MLDINYQKQLVLMVAEGRTSNYIGNHLGISFKTVEKHIADLKKEYNAFNITNLVHIFHQRKLIK